MSYLGKSRWGVVPWLHGLLFLSGAGAFGCQVIWSRMFALGLGAEMPSVLGVVTAVFSGLALGAWACERWRFAGREPLRAYAVLEAVAAGWMVLGVWLIPVATGLCLRWGGPSPGAVWEWLLAFGAPWLALLPATAALGATLPVVEAALHRLLPSGRWVGSLYAAQTVGAVWGVLGGGLGLAAWVGHGASLLAFAGIHGLCGAVAWRWARAGGRSAEAAQPTREPARGLSEQPSSSARIGWLLAGAGLLGTGYEMLVVRALREVLEGTVFTFALVLAVYLVGAAIGAAAERRLSRRRPNDAGAANPVRLFRGLLTGLAAVCWAGWWAVTWSPATYDGLRAVLGDSLSSAAVAELLVAVGALLAPAVLMGLTFATLAERWRRARGRLGTAVALNTLGAVLAPGIFGVLATPQLGLSGAGLAVVGGYLGLALVAGGGAKERPTSGEREGAWRAGPVAGLLLLALLFLLVRPHPGGPGRLPAGARLLTTRVGASETVHVVEERNGARTLRVGRHLVMGGTGAAAAERLQAHFPLLLHPAPRRTLFLGAGTAITPGAAMAWPGVEVTAVELLPEVVAVAPLFAPASGFGEWPARMRLMAGDARRWVRAAPGPWDVVVGDLFHPARDGAAGLFTREQFQAVRERLAPDGLFCQWLPLHQLQGVALRSVLRTFLAVFPEARAWWLRWDARVPVLGLVGSRAPRLYGFDWTGEVGRPEETRAALRKAGLDSATARLARFAGGADLLRRWAGDAPLNTDDHPVVGFLAPRRTVQLRATPFEPLAEWLALGPVNGDDLLPPDAPPAERARLRALWNARDVFLRGLLAESRGDRESAVARWVESARLSPDFTTGYARCLTLAVQWAREQPAAAAALLRRLEQARPENPVAAQLRERLFPEGGRRP